MNNGSRACLKLADISFGEEPLLREFIEKLCAELEIEMPKIDAQKTYPLQINPQLVVSLRDLEPGFAMQAKIEECPAKKREELFIYLMRANFLGQGTGGGRIGLDADEKFLTLSFGFSYEMNYQAFKESVEDFVNYVVYWREEIMKLTTVEE
jgi:hypothetical protein